VPLQIPFIPLLLFILSVFLLCGFFRGQYREKKGGVSSGEKQAGVGIQASGSAAGHGVELQEVEPDPEMTLDLLKQYHGLIIRDIEAFPAARVGANQGIIGPYQIVGRLGKLGAVLVAGPRRDTFLLRAPDPPNLELGRLAAFRTTVSRLLRLGRFRVKVSLVHIPSVTLKG
jgi:hypothetical protein